MRELTTLFISLIALAGLSVKATILADYSFEDTAASADANANTTAAPFSVGPGAGAFSYYSLGQSGKSALFSNDSFNQSTESGAVSASDYLSFTLSSGLGKQIDLASLEFYTCRQISDGAGAPSAFSVYCSNDGFTAQVSSGLIPAVSESGFTLHSVDVSALQNLNGTIELRIILWAEDGLATSTERVFRLDELSLEGIVEDIPGLPPFSDSLYVSPHGDDSNPGTREAPFVSLERARQEVRLMNVQTAEDITVYFDSGDYPVDGTVIFDGDDSGLYGSKIIYRAAGSPGSARILGGEPITGWQVHAGDIWKVALPPGTTPHTLYENGMRAREARFPDYDLENRFNVASATYLLADNSSADILYRSGDLPAGDIPGWDLSDAELVISPFETHDWDLWTLPLVNIDTGSRTLEVKKASRSDPDFATLPIYDPSADDSSPGNGSRYFLQGVLDFLDRPGEFHFDSSEGALYYWPTGGDPNSEEILVPVTETIVLIDGSTAAGQVTDICFDGLCFEGSNFTDYYPGPFSDVGYTAGMVRATYTRRIEFLRCHFRNAGFTALLMHDDNADNLVESCLLERAGGGIWLNTTPAASSSANDNHRVLNCLIQEIGRLIHSPALGIMLHMADNCEVANCHIRDVSRWGVSIRGRAMGRPSNSGLPGGNLVHHTVVERACQDSGDAGALHTANVSVNVEPYNVNTYRQMIVRDTRRHPSVQDPSDSNGIFTDFESFGQHVEDVWILGTATGVADYRFNAIQGADGGLVPNHTFSNISWEAGFDSSRMETESIGLRPDFPAEYLSAGRLLFSEDFNTCTNGELGGQGEWSLPGVAGPTVISGVSGTDGTPAAGPAASAVSGTIIAEKTVAGGIGVSPQISLVIEFDLTQNSTGNLPGFGVGHASTVPAYMGVISQNLFIRGEGYGTIYKAYRADGNLFTAALGNRYRIRSAWTTGADDGKGLGSLYIKNLSVGETSFEQLFFDDGAGGLTSTAALDLATEPHEWGRVWLRLGNTGQQTYIDNIEVSLSAPVHATDPFEAWRQANFNASELADPAISGPGADPLGDGVDNMTKFIRGVGSAETVPEESQLGIFFENGEPRVRFTRAIDSFGLNNVCEVSNDLFTWEDYLANFGTYSVEDQDGLRMTVFGPAPGDPVPQKLFIREQYQLLDVFE